MPQSNITIHRYLELQPWRTLAAGLDAVFFEASNTKTFASNEARLAFRERWLGRYLDADPQFAYIALAARERLAGYLVGCVSDPAVTPRFSDLAYFQNFKNLTSIYPAHLHVNLAPEFRRAGLGARLVARFTEDARVAGAPGVHVVTSRSAANVRFYERCGFSICGSTGARSSEILFLARPL